MKILRQYQLDIIFLFFALMCIIWAYFYALKYLGADPHDYQWYVAGPLIIFYVIYLSKIRKQINIADRRAVTGKSLIYWIIFGVTLFATYQTPISAREYWSIELFFIVFSILLSDSYWDFKKITFHSLKEKQELK